MGKDEYLVNESRIARKVKLWKAPSKAILPPIVTNSTENFWRQKCKAELRKR